MLHTIGGARVRCVIDRGGARVPEHAHDWPMLSIFVIGSYLNETEVDTRFISTPSAIFYRAGAAHRNSIAVNGFEQIEIEFDPTWLGVAALPAKPVRRWAGADALLQTRRLLQACQSKNAEIALRTVLRDLLQTEEVPSGGALPPWMAHVLQRLREDCALKVADLAGEVRRHPSWVGAAYRRVSGEGLQQTAARFKVERAARLLRETERSCASVAHECGFSDQSHMNRTFRRVLARSPGEARADRQYFRGS